MGWPVSRAIWRRVGLKGRIDEPSELVPSGNRTTGMSFSRARRISAEVSAALARRVRSARMVPADLRRRPMTGHFLTSDFETKTRGACVAMTMTSR